MPAVQVQGWQQPTPWCSCTACFRLDVVTVLRYITLQSTALHSMLHSKSGNPKGATERLTGWLIGWLQACS